MKIKKDGPYTRINNILAGQTPEALNVFTPFLLQQNFDLIIEIGSGRGGFTEFLFEHCKNVISFDITPERNESNNGNIQFRIGDSMDAAIIIEIGLMIEQYDKVLILCDGGSKEQEVFIYSGFLNKGSYIMCHDYAYNQDSYQQNQQDTLWPTGPESYYHNIKDRIAEINVVKAPEHDAFSKVFWGCFIKQ